MLNHLEGFKTNVDLMKSAGMMKKAEFAEASLNWLSLLASDLALITHEYAGRAEQLEKRIYAIENNSFLGKLEKLNAILDRGMQP